MNINLWNDSSISVNFLRCVLSHLFGILNLAAHNLLISVRGRARASINDVRTRRVEGAVGKMKKIGLSHFLLRGVENFTKFWDIICGSSAR